MLRGCQLVWQRRRMRELSAIVGSRRRGWATLGLRTHLIASTSAPLPVAHNVSQLISENTERQELFRIEMGGRRAGMRRTPSSAVVGIGSDGDAFELNVTMHKLSRSPRSFGRVFGLLNQTPTGTAPLDRIGSPKKAYWRAAWCGTPVESCSRQAVQRHTLCRSGK